VYKAVHEFLRIAKSRDLLKLPKKCLIAVVLVDVDLPYWTSTVEHIVALTAIFSNICTAHAQKRLYMNFRCKFKHRRSIPRPRFGDVFSWFLHFICWMSDIFLLPVCLTYWPRNCTTRVDLHVDSSPKFEVDMTTHCRVIALLSGDMSRDLVTLTIDFLTLNRCHAWRVTIRSCVMSYNGSHWLLLKIRTWPLRMHRITWPGSRRSKTVTFLESPTTICLSSIQRLLLYDDDISSTSKLIAHFLLKFGTFSLLWQQGSSEQSLTDTI